MNIQRLKERYANNKAIPIHDMRDSHMAKDIIDLIAHIESLEGFAKEVLAINKTSWNTYVDKDPDEQWNECNREWCGDIERLAKIYSIVNK